ncbi:transcriptional regulator [Tumebacillus algifaecis]|uniref:Transcriptional regulator n=1 Tax=Tumebacillus algifaecis TaxID=1214604 RepID=A0A223CXZ1_9BACL|nr:metalloregulator ArsR/SmtB family transcription factor [Tumebacillus algifaecis]ASS74260.1 transcriptional regulator [Tumebacillus algifaecis]
MQLDLELLAECHKALGDKTRLKILALLRTSELCVCELVPILKITQPAISQHLRKLKTAKLVKERRAGQWVFYSLDGTAYPFLESVLQSLPDLSDEIKMLHATGQKVCCE